LLAIAMPSAIVRAGLVYHTMQDTVDAIEPAAVEACLSVAERLALACDAPANEAVGLGGQVLLQGSKSVN